MKFSLRINFYLTVILVLNLVLNPLNSFAQSRNKNVNYADKYFKADDFYLASQYYQKALSEGIDNEYVYYKLGDCARLIFNYIKAEEYYKLVSEMNLNTYPLTNYYYGLMLKNNGKYKKSIAEFDKFIKAYAENDNFKQSAIIERKGAIYILDELQKAQRQFDFQNLGNTVNSSESDFAPTIFVNDSNLVISSARINGKGQEIYGRLGGAYLDNYVFAKESDTIWKNISNMNNFEHLNTPFHDAAGVFTKDKKAFYFTRCDEIVNHNEFHCAIYVSKFEDNLWQKAEKLNENINSPKTWNAQPSLSSTGDTLFFASKREGGKGESDIWYSVKNGQNLVKEWGEAINIGAPINTPFIEMNPQYDINQKVLLYATNGQIGFGGLDIFVANGVNFSKIRNIGLPFNSNRDDFHLVMGDSLGYLSSNRDGGIGNDDIYGFNLYTTTAHLAELEKSEDKRYDHVDMFGIISRNGDSHVEGVEITVKDDENNIIKSVKTNQNGEFTIDDINLQDKKVILVSLPKEHLLAENFLRVDSLAFAIKSSIVNVSPHDSTTIDIGGVILDKNGNPVAGEKVTLLDSKGSELMHTLTNKNGEFMFRSLDGRKEYTVKTTNDAFVVSNIQIKKNQKGINTASLDEANKGLASRIKTESIYFDFNATAIRTEAQKTLIEIKSLLNKYPNVSLELHGYTDNFGTNAYNIELGEKRGLSALKFLENQGVDRSRIQVKTHGESDPTATNSTFEGRQLNRRVDFYVLGGAKYEQKNTIYIMEPGTTLNDVAHKYNMTLDELKELNDISTTENIKDYEPLRVKLNNSNPEIQLNVTSSTNEVKYIYKTDVNQNKIQYMDASYDGYFIVLSKNTLYSISLICQTDIEIIKKINNLNSNTIYSGQVLQISVNPELSKANFIQKYHYVFDKAGVKPGIHFGDVFELEGYTEYHVQKGDQFDVLAKKFNMTNEELKSINNLPDFTLKEGMLLLVKE